MSATVSQQFPFTITVTVTPALAGVALSNQRLSGGPHNAGAVIGAVTVTTNPPGGTLTAPLVLGGPDAGRFALTNSGSLPCNLVVGLSDIPAGTYSITIGQ